MTSKADFETEEWESLLRMPWAAGLAVIVADPSIRMVGEIKAMAGAVTSDDHEGPAGDLIAELIGDMDDLDKDDFSEDGDQQEDALYEFLGTCARIIDAKCTENEAAHVRRWVFGVARTTAEARKEGGFLGVGAVRVSEAEEQALDRISSAIGSV